MNSNVKTINRTILACAAAMALAAALVASNAQAGDPRSETVKFADLNLGTSAGAEELYTRIHRAARRVCWESDVGMQAYTACVEKAESDAIGKVNTPLLTAFYQKKTGKNPPALTANR